MLKHLSSVRLFVVSPTFSFFADFREMTVNYHPHIYIDHYQKKGQLIYLISNINKVKTHQPTASQILTIAHLPAQTSQ